MIMRVTTTMMHQSASAGIQASQAELVKVQNQLSSGRRLVSADDDPIGAARALVLADSKAANEQYARNQKAAESSLEVTEQALSRATDSLQNIRELLVQAAGGGLSDADRFTIVQQVKQQYLELLGVSNTRDSDGKYVFAGGNGDIQPFVDANGGAIYNGDQGRRYLRVSESREMQVTENGLEIFQRVRAGNGTFSTSASSANTGTGTIDLGRLIDSTAYNGDQYRIQFNVSGFTRTYDVIDVTTSTTVSSGNAYSDGKVIQFAGVQVTVSGDPANGDKFDLTQSPNQSVFATIQQAIGALTSSQTTPAARAQMSSQLGAALGNLDQGMESVLAARAKIGAGLSELSMWSDANSEVDLSLRSQLSAIVDVDYAQAITLFARQQQALQAAQESYAKIMKLTLFDVI